MGKGRGVREVSGREGKRKKGSERKRGRVKAEGK